MKIFSMVTEAENRVQGPSPFDRFTIVMPTVKALGIDPLWFAIIYAVTLQTSWLSPPVALSCYFIKGCIPDWSLSGIYRGMVQYIACQVVGIILIMLFPVLVTWLPTSINR
jgi:TRAP-type mannitol/chloroaromatic compound transport system permease large subunit